MPSKADMIKLMKSHGYFISEKKAKKMTVPQMQEALDKHINNFKAYTSKKAAESKRRKVSTH